MTLFDAAAVAASVTAILGCITVCGRVLLRFPMFAQFIGWIREGYREDREERIVVVLQHHLNEHLPELLDRSLAFNGTGRFRTDMRIFYHSVNEFMTESAEDRADLRRRINQRNRGEQHTHE